MHQVAEDVVDKTIEQRDGVVDDLLITSVNTVEEPARQFELGVQHRALAHQPVGVPCGAEAVCGEHTVGGITRSTQPVQVAGRVSDTE